MADSKTNMEKILNSNSKKIKIKDILDLLLSSHDRYWSKVNNKNAVLPEGLSNVRKNFPSLTLESLKALSKSLKVKLSKALDETLSKLSDAELITIIKYIHNDVALKSLSELLNQIEKDEDGEYYKTKKVLIQKIKEFEFNDDLKEKTAQLEIAQKTSDYARQSQLHYEIGILYINNDSKYYQEAILALNQAIELEKGYEEFKAYALRERARLYMNQPETAHKQLEDLTKACQILDKFEKCETERQTTERGRTYLLCAGAYRKEKKYKEAVQYTVKALKLRPHHPETIRGLIGIFYELKAQEGKSYKNPVECLRDISDANVGLNIEDLPAIDEFLNIKKLNSLWLGAAEYGSLKLAHYFADSGVNKQITDDEGNTALHIIAREGFVDMLPFLRQFHSLYDLNKEKVGLTPLFKAAKHGRVAMVLGLINGSQPYVNNTDLLSIAVQNEQGCVLEAIQKDKVIYEKLLLEIGKNYYQPPTYSKESAEEQQKKQREACIGKLFRDAIDAKSVAMLNLLIKAHPEGIHILYQDEYALHYAIKKHFSKGVHRLVANGSNLQATNGARQTPAGIAKETDEELLNFLSNEIARQADEAKEIAGHRQFFIEQVIKQFEEKLSKNDKVLTDSENKKRLQEVLKSCVTMPQFSSFFCGEIYKNIDTLQTLLIDTLNEKVNETTKYEGFLWNSRFDREKLARSILSVLQSSWQATPAATTATVVMIDSKRKIESKAQNEIERLSKSQELFCDRFERQMDAAIAYFTAVTSGDALPTLDVQDQRKIDIGKQVATHLPNIPIPTTGLALPTGMIASGVMDLALYFRQRFRKHQAVRMMKVFQGMKPSERTHFIEYMGGILAKKYIDQIHHLSPGSEGVEQFADCAAARVVEYITSNDSHQLADAPGIFTETMRKMKSWVLGKEIPPTQTIRKTLDEIFLDGIVRVVKSDFPKGKERLRTINNLTLTDQWNANGIFENTGVIVQQENGEVLRYAHPNVDIMKYGYCSGTKEEAESRYLNLGPKPQKGKYWGDGRIWEKPEDMAVPRPLLTSNPLKGGKTAEPRPVASTDLSLTSALPMTSVAKPK